MTPSPAVIPEVVERRLSDRSRNSSGFRDRSSSFQGGERRASSVLAEKIQMEREQRTRLSSLSRSSMRGSFDVENFLAEKDIDISSKTYRDIFPVASGVEAEDTTSKFLYAVVEILLDFINQSNDRDSVVLDFHHPSQITKAMDFSLPDHPLPLEQLVADCRAALRYQVKTGHPHFFNQLSQGLDIVSMAGEWLAATANANMFTYEIAPVFIMMEHDVLLKMREIIGWSEGDSILAPGGSISNMYALIIARHTHCPEHKQRGMLCLQSPLICYTSKHSHYSLKGAAATIGLGLENCREVNVDERGRMDPDHLEMLVEEDKRRGFQPFFVNCTAGTTVYGAFDPINAIADVCEKHNIWLHIDAAWGGGLLMSKTHRVGRFDGVERANSLTWNPHKLLGTLLQCSTFHLREQGVLTDCNTLNARYLFQQDKHYDVSYDTGDKVIQCGRHNDIFKFWLAWRGKGTSGFEFQMDRIMELTQYQLRRMDELSERFHMISSDPEMVNVCFWYVPERLRGKEHDQARMEELGRVTAELKSRMMYAGNLMISYQPLDDKPNFFRSIISNQACTEEDIDFMLEELDRLGIDL